ncbi:biotin-dependent carboxyltransferase family protein [Jannaschia seohaensis]|uniref:Allophanate hydrolase n=1 Tax=Jannaschia seohaensis TaxID=475081 RepID=A0A2Y9AU69_9RHOB|nr:urea amidolyase [Jannaschia seohaensis]PWJ18344.1 allophanate hydrolase [Jannaschia seohaensis]SSA46878.1 allophanate hydrolase [Jannaschia seohaensis]
MSAGIEILSCGPLVTVQDDGRPGWLSRGLARGGAADARARAEARALLGGDPGAGIESPGSPLRLRLQIEATLAFTGAEMRVEAEGRAVPWHGAVSFPAGTVLTLRPTARGSYAYIHVAGGIQTEPVLGARAAHLIANLGRPLAAGDVLPVAASRHAARRLKETPDRFEGGVLRVVDTPQTRLFPQEERARFAETAFTRDPRGNRQGVRLTCDGPGFQTEGGLSLLSDFVLPGDLQMTGDGTPYILGPECQTTGGYPRIASVIPADLPRALQAPPGAELRFRFIPVEEARTLADPLPKTEPLVRAPGDDPDLLIRQLIGGVVSARGEME